MNKLYLFLALLFLAVGLGAKPAKNELPGSGTRQGQFPCN
jgi:hypothetical protein